MSRFSLVKDDSQQWSLKKERKMAFELIYKIKQQPCNSEGVFIGLCGPNYTSLHTGTEENQKQKQF